MQPNADNPLRIEHGLIEGDLRVQERMRVDGVVSGNITVIRGGELDLHGTGYGSLVIEADGRAVVYGTVKGEVWNAGGRLEITGTVEGFLRKTAGTTIVHSGAVISGVKQP